MTQHHISAERKPIRYRPGYGYQSAAPKPSKKAKGNKPGRKPGTTFLYRHYDDNDDLLYVGISLSAVARLSQHRHSPWFAQIRQVVIEPFGSRRLAVRAEAEAIREEKPKFNVVHQADEGLIFEGEIVECIGITYPTLQRWMKVGYFPVPAEAGGSAWLRSDIDAWMSSRPVRHYKSREVA